jgi:pyruvate dehydrogenase E1 component
MFGFQRVGDLIWAAADQRARGFLIGATAGRTTLGGEGLQHQDGSSQVAAAMVPNCRAYDPGFAGELAVILDHGMRELLERGVDAFYYITVGNESYPQLSVVPGSEQDLLRGLYRLSTPAGLSADAPHVKLLGSGAILREALAAAELLESDWNVHCDVYSATSFSLLARDAADVERWNRLNPGAEPRRSHVGQQLAGARLTIAATDYVRAYAQSIAPWVPGRYVVLGTDGFGRSDTRKALRRFFEVDRSSIVIATLSALAEEGQIDRSVAAEVIRRHGVSTESPPPWER